MTRKARRLAWPEVFFSTKEFSARVAAARKRGELRELGPRLYASRLDLEPEELLRKHWRTVVAGYFPGSVIGFRTVLEGRPTRSGDVFITAGSRRVVALAGLRISAVEGPGPLEQDMPLPLGLFWASRARALLESARPSRSRGGTARGLRPHELEAWLERFHRIEGEDRLNALRDQMRRLAIPHADGATAAAPLPDCGAAFERLDTLIGTLLGTRNARVTAPSALARIGGAPIDTDRLDTLTMLHELLAGSMLPAPVDPAPTGRAARHLAFLDAYFSNYIEGCVFRSKRPADPVQFGQAF